MGCTNNALDISVRKECDYHQKKLSPKEGFVWNRGVGDVRWGGGISPSVSPSVSIVGEVLL